MTQISTKVSTLHADTLVVAVDGSGNLPPDAEDMREYYNHLVEPADKTSPFSAKWGQILNVPMPAESNYARVILVGIKQDKPAKRADFVTLGGKIAAMLRATGAINVLIPRHHRDILQGTNLALVAEGLALATYKFDRYKAAKPEADKTALKYIGIDIGNDRRAATQIEAAINLVAGVNLTRDLGNEPPNSLYPESFAKWAEKELKPLGIKVEIFDEKQLAKMKAGGILGVGQGSERPPRMVIMSWHGNKTSKKVSALVGKGVTFDTGGISIKPSAGMEEMKFDMCGAGAVVGTLKALALNKAKVNVVGAIGLAENMPSHNAMRPGDIITSYAGKTVEVLNTDAEGRLVLMDVLTYVQQTHKPTEIIDLATLTGAIIVSLGHGFAGTFVNNDKLWENLNTAAEDTGERMWRMPLDESYRKAMEGSVSDLQNLASWDRAGGSCTAAGFLEHFIEGNTPWAHIDIAGTAWGKGGALGPKGASGYGVRMLYRYFTAR